MKRSGKTNIVSLLALVAIAMQVFLPGGLAIAESRGVDISRFICAPFGQEVSKDAENLALQISEVINETDQDPVPFDGHCPLCMLAFGAPLQAPTSISAPLSTKIDTQFPIYVPGLVEDIRGPPVGATGPPELI